MVDIGWESDWYTREESGNEGEGARMSVRGGEQRRWNGAKEIRRVN